MSKGNGPAFLCFRRNGHCRLVSNSTERERERGGREREREDNAFYPERRALSSPPPPPPLFLFSFFLSLSPFLFFIIRMGVTAGTSV